MAYQHDAPVGGSTDVGTTVATSTSATVALPALRDESDYAPITITGIQNPIGNAGSSDIIIDFNLGSSETLNGKNLSVELLDDVSNIGAELIIKIEADGGDIGDLGGEALITITSVDKDYPIYYLYPTTVFTTSLSGLPISLSSPS